MDDTVIEYFNLRAKYRFLKQKTLSRNIVITWHLKILNDSSKAQELRVGEKSRWFQCSGTSIIVEVWGFLCDGIIYFGEAYISYWWLVREYFDGAKLNPE